METKHEEEHILETLWDHIVEKEKKSVEKKIIKKANLLKNLKDSGMIIITKDIIKLTEKGYKAAQKVVRRHRLAERLLYDVLSLQKEDIEEPSCEFEHILSEDVEESICTLLGHPKECPHGKPIPQGKCCAENFESAHKIVSSLSELKKGVSGKIAYVLTKNSNKLQKLMALGVLPGKPIDVLRTFPSYVFQIRNTQIVIDKEMAKDIYVRISNNKD